MNNLLIYLVIAFVVALIIARFLFPNGFARSLIALIRKIAGLTLRSVEVDGLTWPYLEGGKQDSETVILVHGFGGDKDNWPLYARELSGDYHVIAPDLPGFGDNDKDPSADYSITAQTERLARFATALGIDRFHITGNSMGGYIALKFALLYPDRLKSMTLLNNAGVTSVNKSEAEEAADRGENMLVVNSIKELKLLMKKVAHKQVPLPDVLLEYFGRKVIKQRDLLDRIFWDVYEDMTQRPLNDELSRIAVPTLTIWGRHDRILDVSCTEAMKARIPDHECLILEDVGHVPMIERPATTAAAQRKLISRACAAMT